MLPVIFFLFSLALSHSENIESLQQWIRDTESSLLPEDPNQANENTYLKNVRAITNGGTNAEAYWSFDGKKMSFQGMRSPLRNVQNCDQVYTMNADGSDVRHISTGRGRDTCSYYYPDGVHVVFSQTTSQAPCPPTPDQRFGYVWPIYKDMDIFVRNTRTGELKVLVNSSGYDAEATISPDGKKIIFTSARDGDLELYTMNLDGSELRRMTYSPGYDGGAFISNNNKMMVWRSNRPKGVELLEYFRLVDYGVIIPTNMHILVQNVSLHTSAIQLTTNGTNFAPSWLPDDSGIIFSSNLHDPRGGNFQLYTIKLDGTQLTRITTEGHFNSFPHFSPDGKTLSWSSDRGSKVRGDMNIFHADWIGPGQRLQNIRKKL